MDEKESLKVDRRRKYDRIHTTKAGVCKACIDGCLHVGCELDARVASHQTREEVLTVLYDRALDSICREIEDTKLIIKKDYEENIWSNTKEWSKLLDKVVLLKTEKIKIEELKTQDGEGENG